MDKTEYAFPQGKQVGDVSVSEGGVTLRDYFAAKALQGLLHESENCSEISDFAEFAYVFADAMLDARNADNSDIALAEERLKTVDTAIKVDINDL